MNRTMIAHHANEAAEGAQVKAPKLHADSTLATLIAWAKWCDANGEWHLLSDTYANAEHNYEYNQMTHEARIEHMWTEINGLLSQ